MTPAPNEDSNQRAHPRSLIRVFVFRMKKLCILGYSKLRTANILIRVRECAVWSECSLGAHVQFFDVEAEMFAVIGLKTWYNIDEPRRRTTLTSSRSRSQPIRLLRLFTSFMFRFLREQCSHIQHSAIKGTVCHMRATKAKISLRIRAVWSWLRCSPTWII